MLAGSQPAAGASLATAPHRLILSFTEPPDPRLSSVELLDTAGAAALDFTLPSHVGVGANLALRRGADGVWRGRSLQLSIVGDWSCEVVVGPPATAVVIPLTVRIAPR